MDEAACDIHTGSVVISSSDEEGGLCIITKSWLSVNKLYIAFRWDSLRSKHHEALPAHRSIVRVLRHGQWEEFPVHALKCFNHSRSNMRGIFSFYCNFEQATAIIFYFGGPKGPQLQFLDYQEGMVDILPVAQLTDWFPYLAKPRERDNKEGEKSVVFTFRKLGAHPLEKHFRLNGYGRISAATLSRDDSHTEYGIFQNTVGLTKVHIKPFSVRYKMKNDVDDEDEFNGDIEFKVPSSLMRAENFFLTYQDNKLRKNVQLVVGVIERRQWSLIYE